VPAVSAPLTQVPNLAQSVPSAAQEVYYRRGYGYRGGGRYYRGYGYRGGYGSRGYGYGTGAAVVGGLAAGAIVGGAIAAGQANAAAQQNAAYCAQRYRSYDPGSGTYLNNDGNRYPCP
jgi:hypothetical protein